MANVDPTAPSFKPGFFDRLIVGLFQTVNKYIPWHKLPKYIGALNLEALRIELRQYNLHDGYSSGTVQGTPQTCPMSEPRFMGARSSDGKFNSRELPLMGCSGMRFGRNFPRQLTPKPTDAQMMDPNPRMLSNKFMKREKFIPATTLNLLAAAWIQFQTHDWFFHEDSHEEMIIETPPGDKWPHTDGKMVLPKTEPDQKLNATDDKCPGYKNLNTAWWDSSQIYGSDDATTNSLREGHQDGKLKMSGKGFCQFLPRDEKGNVLTGFSTNWWLGMELLHTLFAMEHNAICETLRQNHPEWPGNKIFDKARLVNCALMAKIHTVEWTPGILAHPTLQLGMNANWWGLAGEKLTKMVGRLSKTSEVISGIPGSGVDQFGVPYSLTEEFASVYRLHPLIPDTLALFDSGSGAHKSTIRIEDTIFEHAREPLEKEVSFADAFYSFGINFPGAIVNKNYPDFFRNLTNPDGYHRDLGTVDILRDRERGVPRYTAFRRMLRMTVPKTFEELTGGDKVLAAELKEAYHGDIDLVDLQIGCRAEPLPEGFGFSDTAFRIFILMASRRLKSDRFIAGQWNAEMYTKEGLEWVQKYTMKDVLLRHFPELTPVLKDCKNAFAPWKMYNESKKYQGIETTAPPKKK